MTDSPLQSESHIQAYLRVAASRARDTVRIGPFLATFSPHDTNPFLNYAIPDDYAVPTAADVAALVAAYRERDRVPRLEYLPQLAPAVEAALVAGGFTVEGRLPLMLCTPDAVRAMPQPQGIALIAPTTDAWIVDTVAVQNEAYGEGAPTSTQLAGLRNSMAAGGLAILARDSATGEPVGAGTCTVPAQHTTEVAGIGVRAAFRRRGIAAALTERLTRDAFAAGVTTAFLMAGHEVEERIYSRVGFVTTASVLLISLR